MFGSINVGYDDINEEENLRYHALYCGLCRALEERYGQRARTCLSYDLTFVAMLYNSLYEPDEEHGSQRCVMHPLKTQDYARSIYTDYAADLSIAFAYHKCLDDWHDEKKISALSTMKLLKQPYRLARARIPEQCKAIESILIDIRNAEADDAVQPDETANRFGMLMGYLLAYRQDQWTDTLRLFGVHFGRFIYMMDAAIDYRDDRKTGNYNPFVSLESTPADMKVLLTDIIGRATTYFEKLPLVQDVHLLRSTLYAGVWQKFNTTYQSPQEVSNG